MIIMRIGWATGTAYEWTQHWHISIGLGIAPEDMLAVRDWQRSTRLGERDRAAMAATDEVIAKGAIGAENWARLAELFPYDELFEIPVVIATWHFVSVVARSIELPLEPENSPLPDGKGP